MSNMNRRAFLGAAATFAGLGFAPAWGQFEQRRREIDLTPFCDDYACSRYDLTSPFAQGDKAIATDGRVLVRTTLAALPEVNADRRLPNIEKIPYWDRKPDKWLRWPRELYVGTKGRYSNTCPFCDGKGGTVNVRQCTKCNGEGYRSIICGDPDIDDPSDGGSYEIPCKSCLKTGWLWDSKCSHCNGKGETVAACYQPIGKAIIASHYDAKLRRLGDLEFCVVGEERIVKFRGDGFDGLLMPLTVKPEEVNWHRGRTA